MPLKMALHECVGKSHYGRLRRSSDKGTRSRVELQHSVFTGAMLPLGAIADNQFAARVLLYVEANGVDRAIDGNPCAAGISKVAG